MKITWKRRRVHFQKHEDKAVQQYDKNKGNKSNDNKLEDMSKGTKMVQKDIQPL